MKEMFKQRTGITLIALIVTIIVLLILAGVSVAMLTGKNGILTQAQGAKEETERAQENEKNIISDYEKYITSTISTSLSEIKGKYFYEDTQLTIDGNKILIPAGATVSGLDNECSSINGDLTSKDGGLVIYITNGETVTDWEEAKTKYDQFVWIPVEKAYVTVEEIGENSIDNLKNYISASGKYPMAIELSKGEYRGILYNLEETEIGTLTITPYDYNTTDSYREPDCLSGLSEDTLQMEFNTMVTRVNQNGGFWVGRYETSNMSSSSSEDLSKRVTVIKGATTGIRENNWYRMYNQQKNYKNLGIKNAETSIISSMIWGSQWDQIMLWMREVPSEFKNEIYTGSFYVTNSIGMGNFGTISEVDDGWNDTSLPAPTGNSDSYKVKNIFDLAGNVYDWTLEAHDTGTRVIRGGYYAALNSSYTTAGFRIYYYLPANSNYSGSRLTLY